MEIILSIATALTAGLFLSRFVKPMKLPAVTGYLVAGILIVQLKFRRTASGS